MGSVFKTFSEQPKRSIQQIQNQCSGSPIKTIATEKEFKEFEIDNFHQQCHSTQTASITCHKVASQASFSERRQQEKFCQKVYIDALATQAGIEPKTIVISSLTKPNSLQSCRSNCRSLKIIKNENKRIGQKLCQLRDDRFRTRNNYLAKTYLCLHGLLLEAQDTLTQLNKLHEDDINVKENKNRYPLADLSWYRFSLAGSVVPATMSAAVVSNLSGTLVSACYFLAQHCKAYSHSFRLYAASSLILLLCYLTTLSTAAGAQLEAAALEKHPIFDESSSDKEILDLLLEKKRYDKRLLPPVNDEDFCCGLKSPDMASNQNARRPHNRGTLTVNVNVLLLSLASPDESSLKYEVEFLLNQQWSDPRLQYGNKSDYDFLNALHHHDSIWTPDTYFIMHGDFKDPIIPMHFALRIFRNGTITYAMRRHLILSCQGSLHIFPFDDPKCSFSMESISYEEAQIKYVWKNDEDTLRKSPSLTTLNAYLIKNQTTPCDQNSWRGNYSCLRVDLIFTRDRAFYFTTVFIPGIILVTSSFITFWLEWNAVPARSMIGVTTMLNFFTTSNGFRSTLPVVSNLTAMNVWDGVCMCFIYASLLEFVCVNYVGRKRPLHNVVYRPGENPVTQRLPAVLSRIGVILASPLSEKRRDAGTSNDIVACTTCGGNNSPCTHSANNGCATEPCFVQMRKKEPPHPIRVAKTIDVIARITFPTAYAIFLIFFFVHYKGFS